MSNYPLLLIGIGAYFVIGFIIAIWYFAGAYIGTKDSSDFNVGFDGLGLLIFTFVLLFWPVLLTDMWWKNNPR